MTAASDSSETVAFERVIADEIHAGAMAAVLGAGGDQLGEHLGGIAVRESFDRPHVCLVQ